MAVRVLLRIYWSATAEKVATDTRAHYRLEHPSRAESANQLKSYKEQETKEQEALRLYAYYAGALVPRTILFP